MRFVHTHLGVGNDSVELWSCPSKHAGLVADLHSKILDACTPSVSNFFIFMQLLEKFG